MNNNGLIYNILMLGSLRLDLYLNYDFSTPMTEMEIKLRDYTRKIGGSVYNTAHFINMYQNNLNVSMFVPNHTSLINEFSNSKINNSISLLPFGEPIPSFPMSIIGVDPTGEKRMLSFDTNISYTNLATKFVDTSIGDFFYSSFYEINPYNYECICYNSNLFIERDEDVMIDLCPLINNIDIKVITEVLKSITILSGNKLEYEILKVKLGIYEVNRIFESFPNIKMLCIKRGAEGAEIKTNDGVSLYKECTSNSLIKNTTGCGDVFNAIVIIGMINNWPIDKILHESIKESSLIAERGLL